MDFAAVYLEAIKCNLQCLTKNCSIEKVYFLKEYLTLQTNKQK